MQKAIAWKILINDIDNGLIVRIENQNEICIYKFYCKDLEDALVQIGEKILLKEKSK